MRYSNIEAVMRFFALLAVLLTLSACGSNDGDGNADVEDTVIARVDIAPGAVTLASLGETYALNAKAFNAAGGVVIKDVVWTSNHPDNIAVDADGMLTAMNTVGSALITAEVDGVVSAPVTVLVVLARLNTQFVDDIQVVDGSFELVDPTTTKLGVGVLYKVTLTGINPPAIGTILLGREDSSIAGEVVGVEVINNDVVVTIKMLPLNLLIDDLKIDEVYDFSNIEPQIAETMAEFYTMEKQADGSYLFTLIPGVSLPARALVQERGALLKTDLVHGQRAHVPIFEKDLGPMKCERELSEVPLSINVLTAELSFDPKFSFPITYHKSNRGLERMLLIGEGTAKFKFSPTIDVAFNGKVTCKMRMMTFTPPVNGWLAAIFGVKVPVGGGVEVGGKITVAQFGAEISAQVTAVATIGLECPITGGCNRVNSLARKGEAGFKWILPDSNLDSQFRIEPSLSAFAYAKVGVRGTGILSALGLEVFEVRAGLKQAANLATVNAQIADSGYASDYKLTAELVGGFAGDAVKAFDLIGVNTNPLEVKLSTPLLESPKALSVIVDKTSYGIGDKLFFDVMLDPNTLEYFLPGVAALAYNIDDIIIYRKLDLGGGLINTREIARVSAANLQKDFSLSWIADESSGTVDSFFAFVDTKVLNIPLANTDLPFLDELELGKAGLPPVLITFDLIPGMINRPTRESVPTESQLGNDLVSTFGVSFTSGAGFAAVVNHGNNPTPSPPNVLGGTDASGLLDYIAPVDIAFFDPSNPAKKAVTDFISIRGDQRAVPGATATMEIFGVSGNSLGTVTASDSFIGLTLEFTIPGIHSARITQTRGNGQSIGTIGYDNLMFRPVTPVP